MRHWRLDPCRARNTKAPLATLLLQNRSFGCFGSRCAPESTYRDLVNRVFTPTQGGGYFRGEIVALQTQYDDDIKIDGEWYVRNKSKWGFCGSSWPSISAFIPTSQIVR